MLLSLVEFLEVSEVTLNSISLADKRSLKKPRCKQSGHAPPHDQDYIEKAAKISQIAQNVINLLLV